MRPLSVRITAICAGLIGFALPACESTEPKRKPRPPLPGEELNEQSWNKPTGPNDVATPYGLPMSR